MVTTSDDELEYLSPGFDPATLTVPRLRSILVSHDIEYSASSKKPQLIAIFNERLVPRARKILNARDKMKRTSSGITDVPSSREASVAGGDEDVPAIRETSVTNTGRGRKPRSARVSTGNTIADFNASKASGRRRTATNSVATEIEPAAKAETARPLARRNRRSAAPEVKVEEEEAPQPAHHDESPFSNSNPFQSGSSPLVQSEDRRKSAGKKSDRKSASNRRKTEEPARIKQEPDTGGYPAPVSSTYEVSAKSSSRSAKREEIENPLEAGEEFTAEEEQALFQEGLARGEVNILNHKSKIGKKSRSTLRTAPVAILATLLASYAAWWRKEKIEVGYCGVGKPSTTLMDLQLPERLALVLQPQCEPCPPHAYCYADMEARCEHDFMLRSHPFSVGGIVPLPPTCEPDGEKVRKVKTVADKAVEELRDRRAKFECGVLTKEDGKVAKTVEISESSLKAEVSSKRRRGITDQEFEDLWKGAIGEITAREEVSSDMDA
ncbi:MAG: hypothetical protein LQ340_002528 [Diploschistes diacapsis]|nr:MAG: hypothetical protein LQ340_002528 [Diploschistes diacapsis]